MPIRGARGLGGLCNYLGGCFTVMIVAIQIDLTGPAVREWNQCTGHKFICDTALYHDTWRIRFTSEYNTNQRLGRPIPKFKWKGADPSKKSFHSVARCEVPLL